ncbi:MAG TPA: protein kinase, partial [Polyangium sp.]|nr:protein kinase [Polyangium sp.]
MTSRFLREARAQARIDHENVCKVFEVGEVEDKSYIAMQFVAGDMLDKAGVFMTLDEKVIVMRDIARALHAAHTLGILHRDIKPSNIMVEVTDDGRNKPILTDFGLARDEGTNRGMTETGAIIGTPAYMSPEQARGARYIDRRSDVYSLGATLYELLCGQPPFTGDSTMNIVIAVLSEDPLPLRSRIPSLPADLSTIASKCLHKDPNERYESARMLAEDLNRYILGEPILGRRRSAYRRLRHWAGKHRALVTTALLAFVALTVVGGIAIQQRIRAAQEKAVLEAQSIVERELGQDIKEMEWFLRTAHMTPLHDVTHERGMVKERMKRIEERRTAGGRIAALVDYAIGRGHLVLGEYDPAHERLSRALDNGIDTPELHYALGLVLGHRYQQAMMRVRGATDGHWVQEEIKKIEAEYLTPALGAMEKSRSVRMETPSYLEGLIAFYKKDYAAAVQLAEKAAQEAPWSYEGLALGAESHLSLGNIHKLRGEREQAQHEFDEAVRLFDLASELGRSDGLLYERNAEARMRRMELLVYFGIPLSENHHAALLETATQAARARPDRGTPFLKIAFAHGLVAKTGDLHGRDPRAALHLAIAALERARAIDGDTFSIHEFHADCMLGFAGYEFSHGLDPRQSFENAILQANKAIELDPMHPWGWLASSHARRGKGLYAMSIGNDPTLDFSHAIANGMKAVELEGGYGFGWDSAHWTCALRAQWLASRGKDPKAEIGPECNLFDRCMQANPKGQCQENEGMLDYYIAEYQVSANRDPTATFLRAETNLQTASTILINYLENRQLFVGLRFLQALHAFHRGTDATSALGALDKSLADCFQLDPKDTWCTLFDARRALLEADVVAANHGPEKPALEKALNLALLATERDPRNADTFQLLADVERHLAKSESEGDKHRRAGIDACAKGMALNPHNPRLLLTCGLLHLLVAQSAKDKASSADKAREMLENAAQLNPLLADATEKPLREAQRMTAKKGASK